MARLTPAEYHATQAKVAKINERAAKKGFTGTVTLTAERVESTNTVNGFQVTKIFYDAEISGEAPSYNGWTLLAAVDYDSAADALITRNVPGSTVNVARESLVAGWCDHCQTTRPRNHTYVVVNAETGEQKQVGSTCIKDFLGWEGAFSFLSEESVSEDLGWGGFGGGEQTYATADVLTIAWAAIRSEGWKPSSFERPTRSLVSLVLEGPSPFSKGRALEEDRARIAAVRALAPEAAGRGQAVLDYVRSDEFKGDNDYVANLKAVCAKDTMSASRIGLVVSAHVAYAKHIERALKVEKAATLPASEWVGAVKDKVTVTGQITNIRYIEGDYGTTVLYVIRNQETGVEVKWFASREQGTTTTETRTFDYYDAKGMLAQGTSDYDTLVPFEQGNNVTITGTVKGHDEYQGRKATILTRCKIV